MVCMAAAVVLDVIAQHSEITHSAGCISQSERYGGSCVSGQTCQSGMLKMAGYHALQVSPRLEGWQEIMEAG